MRLVIRKGLEPSEQSREAKVDLCVWLNEHPDIKAALEGVVEAYLDYVYDRPNYVEKNEVIKAAATVDMAAGGLLQTAWGVYYWDDAPGRTMLHVEANKAAAAALRFLVHIGDLKSKEQLEPPEDATE